MSFEGLLTHDAYLVTKASSQNYLGEWTYTWTDASTVTKCRMSPLTAEQRLLSSGRFDDITYTAFFASGVSLSFNNRVKFEGKYYEVKERYYDSSRHHLTCLLKEI